MKNKIWYLDRFCEAHQQSKNYFVNVRISGQKLMHGHIEVLYYYYYYNCSNKSNGAFFLSCFMNNIIYSFPTGFKIVLCCSRKVFVICVCRVRVREIRASRTNFMWILPKKEETAACLLHKVTFGYILFFCVVYFLILNFVI